MRHFTMILVLAAVMRATPGMAETGDLRRALEANRTLLTRFEAEYNLLSQLRAEEAGGIIRKELSDLALKIKAVREDSAHLSGSLPETERARRFLHDVVVAETAKRAATARKRNLETSSMHEKALTLVSRGKIAEASQIYEDIVIADPEDDQAYILLGHTRLLTGRYAEAEEAFFNAVHIDPADRDEIVPFYENLALQNPDDARVRSNLGYAYLILGDFRRAEGAFGDALSIDPADTAAIRGLEVIARAGA